MCIIHMYELDTIKATLILVLEQKLVNKSTENQMSLI